jgi:hypothetical protein
MRGRVDSENELYLDMQHEREQRPSSAPPDPHQFQFPAISQPPSNEEHVMRKNSAWSTNNQPIASPIFDPSSSSRQVWSNSQKSSSNSGNNVKNRAATATMDQYYSGRLSFFLG